VQEIHGAALAEHDRDEGTSAYWKAVGYPQTLKAFEAFVDVCSGLLALDTNDRIAVLIFEYYDDRAAGLMGGAKLVKELNECQRLNSLLNIDELRIKNRRLRLSEGMQDVILQRDLVALHELDDASKDFVKNEFLDLAMAAVEFVISPSGSTDPLKTVEKQFYMNTDNKMLCPASALDGPGGLDRDLFSAAPEPLAIPDLTGATALIREIDRKATATNRAPADVLREWRADPNNDEYPAGDRPISRFLTEEAATLSAAVPPGTVYQRKQVLTADATTGKRPVDVALADEACWRPEINIMGSDAEMTCVEDCRNTGNDQGESTWARKLCGGKGTLVLASVLSHARICLDANGDYHSGGLDPFEKEPVIALYIKRSTLVNRFAKVVLKQRARGFGDSSKYVVCVSVCVSVCVCVFPCVCVCVCVCLCVSE
jgi:hypothetical protein